MAIALSVILIVVVVFALRVALFRRAAIGGRARSLMDGPLAPARRIARRRRSGR
jgi:hypothetical protein